MDGLPSLLLWEEILSVMYDIKISDEQLSRQITKYGMYEVLTSVDYVPHSISPILGNAKLVIMEDNDAVIKMIIKGRTNKLRHVPRTHRIDLDWLFTVMREDPGLFIKYINTKEQIADIFTKGMFTAQQWDYLTFLCCISDSSLQHTSDIHHKHVSIPSVALAFACSCIAPILHNDSSLRPNCSP